MRGCFFSQWTHLSLIHISHLEEEAKEIAHIDLIDEDLLKKDRTKAKVHVYISPEESPAEAIAFLSERYHAEGI